jgi:hypothetical protein
MDLCPGSPIRPVTFPLQPLPPALPLPRAPAHALPPFPFGDPHLSLVNLPFWVASMAAPPRMARPRPPTLRWRPLLLNQAPPRRGALHLLSAPSLAAATGAYPRATSSPPAGIRSAADAAVAPATANAAVSSLPYPSLPLRPLRVFHHLSPPFLLPPGLSWLPLEARTAATKALPLCSAACALPPPTPARLAALWSLLLSS